MAGVCDAALVPEGTREREAGTVHAGRRLRHSSRASGGLPSSIFTRLELAAISNALPVRRAGGWRVVLFSTGYGIERQLYTGLVEDLASHGYVVVAIDHPHDANIVSFPDGHAVSIGNVGESKNAISSALTVRIADTRYVLSL